MRTLLILLPVLLVILAGFTVYGNLALDVTKYRVRHPKLPAAFKGMKILLLSDLHDKQFGKNYERLIEKCARQKPTIIFFTGDLITRGETNINAKVELVRRLTAIAPVYFTLGNHEVENFEAAKALIPALEEAGAVLVVNTKRILEKDGESVSLYGLSLENSFYRNKNGGYRYLPPVTKDIITARLGEKLPGEFVMLLAHNPLPFEEYAAWGADLTFAGHMHGGIVRIPFVSDSGLLSPERSFFPEYSEGIYNEGKSVMVVSRGLGKFRLFNNPEIVLISLK
ncbi:MAG: metallophosphoesterase [Oscillospiraceae bacterium]